MDLICFTEFPCTLFASNISGFKLTLLSRVLKRLRVYCVRLKGVDILTEVVVVFCANEILLEMRHSLWKNDVWNRENVEVLLNFIRSFLLFFYFLGYLQSASRKLSVNCLNVCTLSGDAIQ